MDLLSRCLIISHNTRHEDMSQVRECFDPLTQLQGHAVTGVVCINKATVIEQLRVAAWPVEDEHLQRKVKDEGYRCAHM